MKKALFTALMFSFIALPAAAGDYRHGDMMDKQEYSKRYMYTMMEMMDRNNDGIITMDEHEAHNAHKFVTIDRNKDRRLTQQEIMDYKQSRMKDRSMRYKSGMRGYQRYND